MFVMAAGVESRLRGHLIWRFHTQRAPTTAVEVRINLYFSQLLISNLMWTNCMLMNFSFAFAFSCTSNFFDSDFSQVDPIVASFSGGAVGVISALMLIEANNVKQQEKKRCKYCHGSGTYQARIIELCLLCTPRNKFVSILTDCC